MAGAERRYLVLLGSNLDRERSLAAGGRALAAAFAVLAASRVYEGPAVGKPDAPPFHNRALLLRAAAGPGEARRAFRGIEEALGRVRTEDPAADRTLDVDLLLVLDGEGRPVPGEPVHPDLLRHHYAALPAAEVAGGVVLPGDGRTVAAVARDLGPPPVGFRAVTEG